MLTQTGRGKKSVICPLCGKEVKGEIKYCTNCGYEIPGRSSPTVQKVNLSTTPKTKATPKRKKLILIAGILLVFVLFISNLNSPINLVKNGILSEYGSQTIEEVISDNFKRVTWSSEKLDDDSGFVYIEGYCVTYQENIRIKFYYDKESEMFQLTEVDLLDSGERATDAFSLAIFLEFLYS